MHFNEINEEIVEDALISCMLEEDCPSEFKDNNFFLHEFDRSTKCVFLICNELFTDEERMFIRNFLATTLYKKIVVGVIKNKKLFEKAEGKSYDKASKDTKEAPYFIH